MASKLWARLGGGAGLVVLLSGCTAIQAYTPFYTMGPDKTGKAIKIYCGVLGEERRAALREQVNAHAHPHTVRITCNAD